MSHGSGTWAGPRLADGEPDTGIVDHIVAARPTHLRVTLASNDAEQDLQPQSEAVRTAYERLVAADISLGAAITGHRDEDEVVAHACRIKAADARGYYGWLFIDFASRSRHVKRLVRRIRAGDGCPAGGWERVWVNASGRKAGFPRQAAAVAKRMDVVGGPQRWRKWRREARRIARGRAPALIAKDRRWVRRAHRRGVRPVLKLEVPWQTGTMFAPLSRKTQRRLLVRWTKAARRMRFDFIFPIYVHKAFARSHYDARREGTYGLIRRILVRERGRATAAAGALSAARATSPTAAGRPALP